MDELKSGSVEGIDGETPAALYVGVGYAGTGSEEIVVEDVNVRCS